MTFGKTATGIACYHPRVPRCTRRQALATLAAATAGVPWPGRTWAAARADSRALTFAHLHTGERLAVEYCTAGHYMLGRARRGEHAAARLSHRRCPRDRSSAARPAVRPARGDRHDPALRGDLGFRSPATNAALRRRSHGVASSSLHMVGQAIDIRVADVPLAGAAPGRHRATTGRRRLLPRFEFRPRRHRPRPHLVAANERASSGRAAPDRRPRRARPTPRR